MGEHLGGLVHREPQLGELHLADMTPGAQAVERQFRRPTGCQHHMQERRDVLEEVRQGRGDALVVVDEMDIVDDKDGDTRQGRVELLHQLIERFKAALRVGQQRLGRLTAPGGHRLERADDTRPQLDVVPIGFVQRQPTGWSRRLGDPSRQQRCLAGAGGRDDHCDRRPDHLIEQLVQPCPSHEVLGLRRWPHLDSSHS